MTSAQKKNNHFHILTGEIWDFEALQDIMRDVVAPYAINNGKCNVILDLSQLSQRHGYNKPFLLSIKRFIDNIYGVDKVSLVITDPDNRANSKTIIDTLNATSTQQIVNWIISASYNEAQLSLITGD